MRKTILSLVVIAIGATAAPATASLPIPQLPSPSSFAQRIDNPWFPLLPGTVYEYRGVRDGKQARDVLTVTHQHATVQGIQTTVLHDRLWLNGRLFERTTDWYAQDKQGNVWYLGESTALLNAHGKVTSTEGSWKAGVGGAHAGIYMLAHAKPGDAARQEYLKGHAADQFKVLTIDSNATLLTQETSQIEPGVVDHKLYVRGIGIVLEEAIKPKPNERLTLYSIKRPWAKSRASTTAAVAARQHRTATA